MRTSFNNPLLIKTRKSKMMSKSSSKNMLPDDDIIDPATNDIIMVLKKNKN